ncbi:hypothetical protein [Chryseobacterium koreense]|uniref:hypothetical protein n=1 Tax=Chryseobacterium koreense TaxID=232216 RepID=UPI0026EF2DE5|nr:hypothetical protein [Chryseobacterium koreense]
MAKFNLGFSFIIVFAVSCSIEKVNLSPVTESSLTTQGQSKTIQTDYGTKKNLIVYSSEISNLIATFPKFKNEAVNKEVANLKFHLKEYIGAMEAYNINGLDRSYRKYEQSYKKIQSLRKYLKPDDDQVLNRYLVRIKTNISLLESYFPKDSLSSIKN